MSSVIDERRRVVLEIAKALEEPTRTDTASERNTAAGLPGEAVFFAHLWKLSGDPVFRAAAELRLRKCAALIECAPMHAGLYGGLSGMAWVISHGQKCGLGRSDLDLSDVDELLIELLRSPQRQHFDLISGLVGIGVYFLDRLPANAGTLGVRLVVERLEGCAERSENGATWLTHPQFTPPSQREAFAQGRYDLGVAHGIAGVVAFLSLALIHASPLPHARTLLTEASSWLLAQEHRATDKNGFIAWFVPGPDQASMSARAAWCYGDPGVAATLLLAASALGDQALRNRAMDIARRAARRDLALSGVTDASVCHGAAGLAHLFSFLSILGADPELGRRADEWCEHVVKHRREGRGIAGYEYLDYLGGVQTWTGDRSFLQGISGIGLVLMSATMPNSDRSWDRLLLLS